MSPDGTTLTCDPDLAVCDAGVNIYAVNYASSDTISVFGSCKVSSVDTFWCCVADDPYGEIETVNLFGTEEADERVAFTIKPASTRFDLHPTGSKLTAVASGRGGNDVLHGSFDASGDYFESLYGNGGMDSIHGNDGDDRLYGGTHVDSLYGGSGNDTLWGGTYGDTLYGNDGNDILYGEGGNDTRYGDGYVGETGADILYGGNNADTLWGGPSNDILKGGAHNDYLYGEAGDDALEGESGDDFLSGGDNDDILLGGDGYDTLQGGAHFDQMNGGAGNDNLNGGSGDDWLHGGLDQDILNGGDGNDFLCETAQDFVGYCPASNTFIGGNGTLDRAYVPNGWNYGQQFCPSMQQLGNTVEEASQLDRDWSSLNSPIPSVVNTIYAECNAVRDLDPWW